MRRVLHTLTYAAAMAAVTVVGTGSARGAGSSTSAGDNQYVEPLTQTGPAPASPAPASSAPRPTQTRPQAAERSSAASREKAAPLPYTGFDVRLFVIVAIGLIAAGLVFRRIARRE